MNIQCQDNRSDKDFDAVKSELANEPYNVILTTCDADRHVEVIERMIRFVKERVRAVRLDMPFRKIPKRLVIEMVERVVILLNSIPREGGIHQILSPREIVTEKRFHCPEWPIGQYGQGMIGGTNSIEKERSVDILYLGRNDNGSGH